MEEHFLSHNKQIISMPLDAGKHKQAQALATRLGIRESDFYQLAVSYTLTKLACLLDGKTNGSGLLPLLLEIRQELIKNAHINKHLLFKIVNGPSNDFVAMSDIELLLAPSHLINQILLKLDMEAQEGEDPESLLGRYLLTKYQLD